MRPSERFFGAFTAVTNEFLARLDRNFAKLERRDRVFAVTTTGLVLVETDEIASVQADATAGAVTVYLPDSPTGNRRRTITKIDASANAVTVDGNGYNINGAATYALAAQYNTVTVEPTGSEWIVI